MAKSDASGSPKGREGSLFSLLRESGDALEAASPPFDAADAAARLYEAATAHRLLRTGGIPEHDLAVTDVELEEEAPPFDVEAGAARLREAATARGLLPGGASEDSAGQELLHEQLRAHADVGGRDAANQLGYLLAQRGDLDQRPAGRVGHSPAGGGQSSARRGADGAALLAQDGPVPAAGPGSVPPVRSYPGPGQAAKGVADLPPPTGYVAARRTARALAGLAICVAAVALAVLLPVVGLIVSLAGITLLRAADRAQSVLAVRRSVRGPQASDLLVVVVTAPLAVARALLAEALMAPLAFAAGVAAYAAAIVLTHHHLPLPQAGAYAAGAMIAWYAIGPGSGRPRRQLNRMAAAVSRRRLSAVAIAVAAWGLAAAIVLLAASQAPDFWPVATPHLPALHGLLSSAPNWLLRHAHT